MMKKLLLSMLIIGLVMQLHCQQVLAISQHPAYSQEYNSGESDEVSVTVSNGYSRLDNFGSIVTKGAQVEYSVINTVHCATEDTIKGILNDLKESMTQQQWSIIEKNKDYTKAGHAAGLLAGALSIILGGKDWEAFDNTTDQNVSTNDALGKEFIKKLQEITPGRFNLKSTVNVEGTSYIPAVVYCHVGITKIQFENGGYLNVFDLKEPMICQSDGSKEGFKVLRGTKLELFPAPE